jgi:hypothetical protein
MFCLSPSAENPGDRRRDACRADEWGTYTNRTQSAQEKQAWLVGQQDRVNHIHRVRWSGKMARHIELIDA